jgi:hypothetical protein
MLNRAGFVTLSYKSPLKRQLCDGATHFKKLLQPFALSFDLE